MRVNRVCETCGSAFETTEGRVDGGRGRYCSMACCRFASRGVKESTLKAFIAQHGRTPEELSHFLKSNEILLSDHARTAGVPLYKLWRDLHRFGVEPYRPEKKPTTAFSCRQCGALFEAYDRPSRAGRNRYCGPACAKAARRKPFDESQFRVRDWRPFFPATCLGQYQSLELGERQRSFVNRDKADHFYFRNGIHDEETAYVFGVLLTDGSVYRNKKGTYIVRLQMTDTDIVQNISDTLGNQTLLSRSESRRAHTLNITSPYLFHDLVALGCCPNKTRTANYPAIPPDLDRHLIRGIIDGDGSWVIMKSGQLLLEICGNDLLMFGINRRIFHHLQITPQSAAYPAEFDPRHKMVTFCHIRYNHTDSLRIRDWLYENARISGDRKRAKAYSVTPPYTDLFTTPRLAHHLGVSEGFVKANVKRHSLPHKQIGPYYYFEKEALPIWETHLKTRLKDPKCRLPNKSLLRERWLSCECD